MADDLEPGRPPVEAVFVAWLATTVAGVVLVQVLAAFLPPPASPDAPSPAAALALTTALTAAAFAVAQALLPGPKSAGCAGLAIPMVAALTLAVRGFEPAAVVSVLFAGVFLTPAAYYLAIRLSFRLRGYARRRPIVAIAAAAACTAAVVALLRLLAAH